MGRIGRPGQPLDGTRGGLSACLKFPALGMAGAGPGATPWLLQKVVARAGVADYLGDRLNGREFGTQQKEPSIETKDHQLKRVS
jgi:hypothetical protein